MSLITDLGRGPAFLTLGARLLATPGVPMLLIGPLIATLVLYGIAIAVLLPPVMGWLEASAAGLPGWFHDWFGFLVTLLQIVLGGLLVLATGWVATLLATLLASPFYGLIAIRIEARLTGSVQGPERGPVVEILATLGRELQKLGWTLPRMIAILLISLIPVLGILASPLALLFGAWVMAVQFVDFTPENRGLSFTQTRARLARRRGLGLGFGALLALAIGMPVINLLVAPAAVAGGTALWLQLDGEWDGRRGL